MFGFLNPRPHSFDYRRAYARLCQHQRRAFGMLALPFHSYEAVFLYQVALDAGVFPAQVMPNVRCCRLAMPRSLPHDSDAVIGKFCASVSLLLASIKLEDDLRDTRGWAPRIARWVLRRRIKQANLTFSRLDPRFDRNVGQLIADHHALESRGGNIPIDEYAEPTALSFGYVFGLASRLPGLGAHRDTLTSLGHKLGAAIIAFDCAVDWKRDRSRGEFNPLPDETSVANALDWSAERLAEAAHLAQRTFGNSSRSAATLEAVRLRVMNTTPFSQSAACPTHRRSIFSSAKRTAKFILVPVFASAGGSAPGGGGIDPGAVGTGGAPPELPGGIEKVNTTGSKGTTTHACCDCCDCSCQSALCAADTGACNGCDCGGCDGCSDCGGCDCNC